MLRQSQSPHPQPPFYSKTGLINILPLLSPPNPHPPPHSSPQTQSLLNLVENDNLPPSSPLYIPAYRLINQLYLLELVCCQLLGFLFLAPNINDKKIIKVIFPAYTLARIQRFFADAGGDGVAIGGLLGGLAKLRGKFQDQVVCARPVPDDLTELYQLVSFANSSQSMELRNNIKNYQSICNWSKKPEQALPEKQAQFCLDSLLNTCYKWISTKQMQSSSKQHIFKLQKIQVLILYLRCATDLSSSKLKKQTNKSWIGMVIRKQGYQLCRRYFQQISLSDIEGEMKYCPDLFKNKNDQTILQRNILSQQSEITEKCNQPYIIRLGKPNNK